MAIVGQVGCGKSTLLSAILGETEKLQGNVFVEVRIRGGHKLIRGAASVGGSNECVVCQQS